MPQEQQNPDGVPTHGPAPAASAPPTAPVSAPTDNMPGIPTITPNTTTSTTTSTAANISKKMEPREEIDDWARTIYNYHRMHQPLPTFSPPSSENPSEDGEEPTRIIFTLCSLDLRVAEYAAHLFLTTFLPLSTTSPADASPRKRAYKYLLFSGHSGLLTRSLTGDPSSLSSSSSSSSSEEDGKKFQSEATLFASIALSMGVPPSSILIEEKSTNTGENVRFTWDLLNDKGIEVDEILLVQKPYMERRTWATFGAQWPGYILASSSGDRENVVKYSVTSPPLKWEEYPDEESGNGRELVVNIMVGDLVRIREYAEKGWQVKMEVPEDVWEAGRRLVEEGGFGGHLPEGFRFS